ncbi:uncharacterized protein LOC122024455 [Zingiber officinale]|uniref:uncharacterized protein LOC122024455 n=1 Tax=Zingiber officinale TaxID=94328 RepID=UPI001C4BE8B1|nr:uncharacterized protein LOC122024455 [Zingiber officinale]XP_042439022.1 uncharacterized protein LOC122024455 [Zingiber officinale]
MTAAGTLDLFPQVQTLVLDKLQVVSYKWLSRNFSVSSNDAKRLLQEFVEKHCDELEVIYTVSGWSKNDPQTYCVKLASKHKLQDIKHIFEENYSVQVYSVQACIPNDLAVIWNAEFVQSEELFSHPSTEENCLRDNRFSAISNQAVKRTIDRNYVAAAAPRPKNGMAESKTTSSMKVQSVQPLQHGMPEKSSIRNVMQAATVSSGQNEINSLHASTKATEPDIVKEAIHGGNSSKTKGQNEKGSSGTTGSLASLWTNASTKSKTAAAAAATEITINAPNAAATAEAQICAQEALDAASSEDEADTTIFRRDTNGSSGRKRRVVLDTSDDDDEDENVVSLAPPDLPKSKHVADSCPTNGSFLETRKSNIEELKGDVLKETQDIMEKKEPLPLSNGDKSGSITAGGISLKPKINCHSQEEADWNKKDELPQSTSSLPKRRKVLKTRIDDRGREVTEVVWEGETLDNKKSDKDISTGDAANRPPVVNKAQAPGKVAPTHPGGKNASKKSGKGGPKDAKQGNILSFFKKV